MKKEDLMSVGMVAQALGKTRDGIHKKIQAGHFPSAFQLADGTWLIDKKDLAQAERNPGRPRTKKESK